MSLYNPQNFVARLYHAAACGLLDHFSESCTPGTFGLYGENLLSLDTPRNVNLFCPASTRIGGIERTITSSIRSNCHIKRSRLFTGNGRSVIQFRTFVYAKRPLTLVINVTFTNARCPYAYVESSSQLQTYNVPFRVTEHVCNTPGLFGGISFPFFLAPKVTA